MGDGNGPAVGGGLAGWVAGGRAGWEIAWRQGAHPEVLLAAFDAVRRQHEAADAESYNDDPTHKGRLNQASPPSRGGERRRHAGLAGPCARAVLPAPGPAGHPGGRREALQRGRAVECASEGGCGVWA